MRQITSFFVGVAAIAFSAGMAEGQTLFDVEHARGNYRAGLVSEYDADLVRTWGAPSGNYPGSQAIDGRQTQKKALKKRRTQAKVKAAR